MKRRLGCVQVVREFLEQALHLNECKATIIHILPSRDYNELFEIIIEGEPFPESGPGEQIPKADIILRQDSRDHVHLEQIKIYPLPPKKPIGQLVKELNMSLHNKNLEAMG